MTDFNKFTLSLHNHLTEIFDKNLSEEDNHKINLQFWEEIKELKCNDFRLYYYKAYFFKAENNIQEAQNNIDEYGIKPDEYAQMAIELFDLCYNDQQGEITESNFVEIASNIATGKPSGCMFSKNCQDNFMAIAPTGDVMPCGRFCDNDLLHYSYGNLHEETLADILPHIKQSDIYKRAEYIANSGCAKCKWYNICHGGCMHDGFLASGDFKHKTFLCSAYKKIFAHIEKRLNKSGIIGNTNKQYKQ